jgi:hypothetical protein
MRRLADWIGGALWGVLAYRLWKRWSGDEREPWPEPAPVEESDERAEELRAKLAENRASESPSPAEPGEPPESVEERRRRVHEEGRAAIDEMRGEE